MSKGYNMAWFSKHIEEERANETAFRPETVDDKSASYRVLETVINMTARKLTELTSRQENLRAEIERLHEEHRQTTVAISALQAAHNEMAANDINKPNGTGIVHKHTAIATAHPDALAANLEAEIDAAMAEDFLAAGRP